MTRRKSAQTLTQDLKPSIAERVHELKNNGFTYFTEEIDPQLLAEFSKFYEEVLNEAECRGGRFSVAPIFLSVARAGRLHHGSHSDAFCDARQHRESRVCSILDRSLS